MSQLTTHVLDTSRGQPAAGIRVAAERSDGSGGWTALGSDRTDADGRASGLLSEGEPLRPGVHRLRFDTRPYFEAGGRDSFYPYVEIVFVVDRPAEHYHVPLLLSPFGYATYRGS